MKQIPLLFIVFLFDVAFAQKYIITRRVRTSSGKIQPDVVQIPSALCHDNGTTECPLMNGEFSGSVCQCTCSEKDSGSRLYKTTFLFHNETWKCAKNAALQKLTGCSFSLDGAEAVSVPTLKPNVTDSHSLSNVTTGLYIQLPVGTTCAVRPQNSAYLKCNGQWEQLNSTLVTKRFQISYGQPSNGKYFGYVWVNSTEHSAYPLPSGLIIRLGINCSDRSWESSQCFVAKIQGQLECPALLFPVPSTTSPQPSTPSLFTAPSSTAPSSMMSVPPTTSLSISQTSFPVSSSTVLSTSPLSHKPNTVTFSGPVPSFPVPSTTTPQPSTTSSSVPSSATPSLFTAQPFNAPPSMLSVSPKTPSSISQTSSAVPASSTVLPTSLPSPKPNTTTAPKVNVDGDSSSKIFSGALIGAVLGGFAALVALVIIIVIIARGRKKRSDDLRKNSSAAMVVENESYEGEDLGDKHHHPYENVNPSFVAATTASALNNNVKGKANTGGHRNSVANKVYEVVEEFDNQPSKPNIKNIKEGQQDLTNRTRKEALSTIPESGAGATLVTFREPHHYDSIIDKNDLQYAPVYDVIDGTQSKGGFNKNDPRAHGASSNMPIESGHDLKNGQDVSFYDTVGSVLS